jgi:dihydroorotase/allantoinase
MEEKGNLMRQNPPIRNQSEQDLLWKAGIFGDGVDYIASDHAPSTDEEKGVADPFGNTWEVKSGFVGLETQVPTMLTFVNHGRLALEKVVEMYSTKPAQIWGLYPEKGSLHVGTDADFTIIDLDETWTLDRHSLHSKNTPTPYDGDQFTGAVTHTIVRGKVAYRDGDVRAEPGDGKKIQVD